MAKLSSVARQRRREKVVAKYAAKRKELMEQGDVEGLRKLPRDSNPNRLKNRCNLTGRTRGYYRKFGLSRLMLRKLAHEGKIPGLVKASW
ncbi:MAG: 30S ribosomal protein S14 [Ignavibacteriales bacterium]|nr:30S ribosomal protein S14 [Ignavibacteriales bacterium]